MDMGTLERILKCKSASFVLHTWVCQVEVGHAFWAVTRDADVGQEEDGEVGCGHVAPLQQQEHDFGLQAPPNQRETCESLQLHREETGQTNYFWS